MLTYQECRESARTTIEAVLLAERIGWWTVGEVADWLRQLGPLSGLDSQAFRRLIPRDQYAVVRGVLERMRKAGALDSACGQRNGRDVREYRTWK